MYATVAIPSGLFRINDPQGQLRMNFGVLSRLTWLNGRGQEGLLGVELGVMGLGLISTKQDLADYPLTLAAVAGVGLRLPLGQGAAVGVHVWGAYEFRDTFFYTDADGSRKAAPNWALIFGPSISIGNVGTNL